MTTAYGSSAFPSWWPRVRDFMERVFGFVGENNMGVKTSTNPEIKALDEGFGLFDGNGDLVGCYSRRRDAVRGATRRGWTIA